MEGFTNTRNKVLINAGLIGSYVCTYVHLYHTMLYGVYWRKSDAAYYIFSLLAVHQTTYIATYVHS